MADAQHIVALPMAQRCACGCGRPTTRGVAKPFLQAHEPSVTAEALTNALLAALAIGELDRKHPGDPKADFVVPARKWAQLVKLAKASREK